MSKRAKSSDANDNPADDDVAYENVVKKGRADGDNLTEFLREQGVDIVPAQSPELKKKRP